MDEPNGKRPRSDDRASAEALRGLLIVVFGIGGISGIAALAFAFVIAWIRRS